MIEIYLVGSCLTINSSQIKEGFRTQLFIDAQIRSGALTTDQSVIPPENRQKVISELYKNGIPFWLPDNTEKLQTVLVNGLKENHMLNVYLKDLRRTELELMYKGLCPSQPKSPYILKSTMVNELANHCFGTSPGSPLVYCKTVSW